MADYATLVFDIDSTQARGAAKALGDLNSAVIKAANGASRFEKTMRDSSGRFQSTSRYIEDNRQEVERLAMAYNPVLAAQIRYRDEAIKTGAAVKAGVITEQQRVDILQRTKAALDATASASGRFGQQQQVATHHVSNLSFQLNDIGMMMASGQNPFMLMIQQGPQVAQIFSTMNAEGRKIGPTLAGAFKMFLNPTTLVTLALIGGSAALAQWGMSALSAGRDSKSFSDSIDGVADAISKISAANNALSTKGVEELGAKYGEVTAEVRSLIQAQKDLALMEAQSSLASATSKLQSSLQGGWLASAFDNGRIAITDAEKAAVRFDQTVSYLQGSLKVSESSAKGLATTLTQAFDEKDPAEYARLVGHVRDYILQVAAAGGEGAKEARKLAEELTKAEDAARQVNAQANNMPSAFNSAANAAAKITDELNRAVSAAARLAASAISDARFAQIELDFRTDAIGKAGAIAAAKFDEEVGKNIGVDGALFNAMRNQAIEGAKEAARIQAEVQRLNEADREAERKANQKSRGSGGAAAERKAAAELRAAEKGFQSLRELLEKESLYQVAEYERRQAQLDNALSKKLISEQNYQLMKTQLQTNYFGSEYERNALQYSLDLQQLDEFHSQGLLKEEQYQMAKSQLQHDYYSNAINTNQNQAAQQLSNMSADFAQMNQLAGGGYDKLLKAQKAFAAGSALINAYLAASQALADPTVSFWGKFAAYAKVLAAGMGAVNAIKGSGSGASSGSSSTASAVKEEPVRNVLLRLEGDPWLTGMAEQLITQFYEASANGRVIVSRDMS